MCTVLDNAGSVLEHVVLTIAVSWSTQRRVNAAVRYVDTHAMAPLNEPVNPGNPALVTDLLAAAALGPVADAAPASARPYLESLGVAAAAHAAGAAHYYPTHFVHAIRSARAAQRFVGAYLFENDNVAPHRRAAIAAALPAAPQLALLQHVAPPLWTASLAPDPGDFRNGASWGGLAAAVGEGEVLIAFSDPMNFVPHDPAGAEMGPDDFGLIMPHLAALQPAPSLFVHVIFAVGGNPGHWGGDWLGATNAIHSAWLAALGAAGWQVPPHAATERVGVQWGGFLVVVCAWEAGPAAAGMGAAFTALGADAQATLGQLWHAHLALH